MASQMKPSQETACFQQGFSDTSHLSPIRTFSGKFTITFLDQTGKISFVKCFIKDVYEVTLRLFPKHRGGKGGEMEIVTGVA